MAEDPIIQASEKLACIRRELTMRKQVYPRWVDQGRMSQAKADQEIRTMTAIERDYAAQVEGERLL